MTEETIKQNADAYAMRVAESHIIEKRPAYFAAFNAFMSGAHSRDEEIKELKEEIESLQEQYNTCFDGFTKRGTKLGELMKENVKLRNPWINVEERLPEVEQYVFTHQPMNTIEKDAEYGVCQYLGGNRWWQADGEFAIEFTGSVDYWMPIPQVPKNDD